MNACPCCLRDLDDPSVSHDRCRYECESSVIGLDAEDADVYVTWRLWGYDKSEAFRIATMGRYDVLPPTQ